MKKAIFLDRDGVINVLIKRDGGKYSPQKYKDFRLFPYIKKTMKLIKEKGYLIIVVTNQPDLENNKMEYKEYDKMCDRLYDIGVDVVLTCPHDKTRQCKCRKPKPYLINNICKKMNIDRNKSAMFGDKGSDIETAVRAKLGFSSTSNNLHKNIINFLRMRGE